MITKINRFQKIGMKKPKATKKNMLIKKAVKKAVHDYKEVYERLAYE